MGVVKAVNSPCSSHAALRNTLEYILKDTKTTSELKLVSGMYFKQEVTPDKVFQNFTEIRKDAGKDNGRMFKHFILSWSKEEDITPEIGLAITNEWVDKIFPEYNACIVSHTDRDHVHCHIVVNSVNNLTGKKLNISNKQFQKMKNINDEICEQYGLSVTKKGKHFDGTDVSEGTIRSYDKTTYHILTTESPKRKIMASVMVKVLEATATACSQDEFIIRLAEAGITTNWSARRQNVSFMDDASGFIIRDKKLADTFSTNLSKEVFHEAFIRNERIQRERSAITDEDDRKCQLLEKKIRGLREGEGTDSKGKSNESENGSTDGLIERISEKIRKCFRQRTPEERGNGESTYRSRNRRHKSMLTEHEQYELRDIASKLEECRNFYISTIYTTLIYNEDSFRDKNYYLEVMNDCEKQKYRHLADYRNLIRSIPIEDLAMVHEEQIAIRDREMRRYENGLSHPKSTNSFNAQTYKDAICIRDEAFSHVATNLKSIEKEHPEITEDRTLSQTPRRGRHR